MSKENVIAAPVSEAGRLHLAELYPSAKAKIKVLRLGTIANGRQSSPSQDGIFRVVSCSGLSPVKRVNILVECLKHINFKIIWHHLGDGILRKELEDRVKELGLADVFIFVGLINSEHVLDYYSDHPIDLFVNVSSSEGVPVSIMEAFSSGIPVFATNVGGTAEIVDENVGVVLPADITDVDLAAAITNYRALPISEKLIMRQNAYNNYVKKCNAQTLSEELADFLIE